MPTITKLVSPIRENISLLFENPNQTVTSNFHYHNSEPVVLSTINLSATPFDKADLIIPLYTFENLENQMRFGEAIESMGVDVDDDFLRITADIINILKDPKLVAKHLKNLDDNLGKQMNSAGIEYSDKDLPEYLIAGNHHFIAGPPPKNYLPRKKGRLLDRILLEEEMRSGINEEGYTAKFVGFVDKEKANDFVADGHIFAEDEHVGNLILHGKYSHRLIFEVIRDAVETGDLDLKLRSGKKLNQKQLLEFLTKIPFQGEKDSNLWQFIMDNNFDLYRPYNPLTPPHEDFTFSSLSPLTVKSLVTCFGKELDLPNLQHYLLDSHWKQGMRAASQIKSLHPELKTASLEDLYTYHIKTLCINNEQGFSECPYTSTVEEGAKSKKYLTTEPEDFIKRKNTKPNKVGKYSSWDQFLQAPPKQAEEKLLPFEKPSTKLQKPSLFNKFTTYLESSLVNNEKSAAALRKKPPTHVHGTNHRSLFHSFVVHPEIPPHPTSRLPS